MKKKDNSEAIYGKLSGGSERLWQNGAQVYLWVDLGIKSYNYMSSAHNTRRQTSKFGNVPTKY